MRILSWSHDASPVAEFAAAELARYVQAMTGMSPSLEVAGSPSTFPTLALLADRGLVPAAMLQRLARDLIGQPPDAYAIHAERETIALAGTTPRATLYGVYDLLRRFGVRFFAPAFPFYAGQHEFVPLLAAVQLAPCHVVERPAFAIRRKYVEEGWSHTPSTLVALIDWMAKNRLNVLVYPYDYQRWGLVRWDLWREQLLPELEKRGLLLEVGGATRRFSTVGVPISLPTTLRCTSITAATPGGPCRSCCRA